MRRSSNSCRPRCVTGRDAAGRHSRDRFPRPDRTICSAAHSIRRRRHRERPQRPPRHRRNSRSRHHSSPARSNPDRHNNRSSGGEGAADHSAGNGARDETAAAAMTIITASRRHIRRDSRPPPPLNLGPGAPPPPLNLGLDAPPLNLGPDAPPPKPPPPPPGRMAPAPPPPAKPRPPPPATGPPPPPPPRMPPTPDAFWAKLSLGRTIGATSAMAAAALKTFRLIIVGSNIRDVGQPFQGRGRSRARARIVRMLEACQVGNCTRNEQIAPIPRQLAAKCAAIKTLSPGRAGITGLVWTIRPADGIRASLPLEPAEP